MGPLETTQIVRLYLLTCNLQLSIYIISLQNAATCVCVNRPVAISTIKVSYFPRKLFF